MKKIIRTDNAPAPIGPYNQAVRAGDMVYLSGAIAIDPASGKLNLADLKTETHQVMANIKATLAAAGADLSHVVKSSIFLSDMGSFAEINEIYGSYFDGEFPARETVEVSCLPKNVNVEISVIAYLGE